MEKGIVRMSAEDRKRFQTCLEESPVFDQQSGDQEKISKPFVQFMEMITQGAYYYEILFKTSIASKYINKLISAGVEFPKFREWEVTQTERRIITACEYAKSIDELVKIINVDVTPDTLRSTLARLRLIGINLPRL